jgi:hypothetical protein
MWKKEFVPLTPVSVAVKLVVVAVTTTPAARDRPMSATPADGLPRDRFGRPVCNGRRSGGAVRCTTPVHPGYQLCPDCKRPYTRAKLEAALALPENEAFRPSQEAADN